MVFVQWWHIELAYSDEVSLGLSKTEVTMDIASPHHPMLFFFLAHKGIISNTQYSTQGLLLW